MSPSRYRIAVAVLSGLAICLLLALAASGFRHFPRLGGTQSVAATAAKGVQPASPRKTVKTPARPEVKGEALAKIESPAAAPAAMAPTRPESKPPDPGAGPAPQGKIDELVFAKLRELGIQPAAVCSDEVFVRRVYLDAVGTLPTAAEAREFLDDRDPNKRRLLIDRLLEREEFADYWAMKWGDLLRVKAEFPINLWPYAAQAYHRWIRTCIKKNVPYDRFVREMLTASGSNFRVPQVNFYRAIQSRDPQAVAQAVALTFMGARAEKWPKDRLAGMAVFFYQIGYKPTSEWKEEIVLFDPRKTRSPTAASPAAIFPDGTPAALSRGRDPRRLFADWLIRPENPWFTRHIVNRVWYWLLGRGIVHEPDDIRPDNPAENPELLNWLGRELVDALCQITGTTEQYSSAIPEPFTFIPEDQRSIGLPDGSITSSFLEMFGRPPRDTGLESERNNRPTAAQFLHLLNSSHIQRKIQESPKLHALVRAGNRPREIIDGLYLLILSRRPNDGEVRVIRAYTQSGSKGEEVLEDVAWSLINSAEFLYRH